MTLLTKKGFPLKGNGFLEKERASFTNVFLAEEIISM